MTCARTATNSSPSTLPLRVDSVATDGGEFTQTLFCTDCEGTELRVGVRGSGDATVLLDTRQWYRFDDVVRSTALGAELIVRADVGDAEQVDPPKRRSHPPLSELDEPWLTQLRASERVVAVTVRPRPMSGTTPPEAGDPEAFEIGAVCLGDSDADETTVYHREEPEPRDEVLLLEHVVADLSEITEATLVTRGRDSTPLGLLRARLAAVSGGEILDSDAVQVLEKCFHANLSRVPDRAGETGLAATAQRLGIDHDRVSLENYDTGLAPSEWREGWNLDDSTLSAVTDSRLTDRDYATLMERYLAADDESTATAELGRCLKAYASVDIPLLGALASEDALGALGCSRPARRVPTSS